MSNHTTLEQKDFEALLSWLSTNREEAGVVYEQIRQGLIRYFRYKGCNDSESLADETINRVASKITTIDTSKNFKIITYFYGFAANVLLENNRKAGKNDVHIDSLENYQIPATDTHNFDNDEKFDCLEKCLKQLNPEDRELVVKYYSKDKIEKIQTRKLLAQNLKCDMNALQVKVFRLRNSLKKCVQKCMKNNV